MGLLSLWDHLDLNRIATFILLVTSVWVLAGWLKSRGVLRTGDARKVNHATVLAGGVLWFNSGDPLCDRVSSHIAVLVLFGLLLMICRWRDAWPSYYAFHGYARESDRPHDAFHVWFSWIVSILGLEIVDLVFCSLDVTRCAALVVGLADAVGEPIGTRFGRHRYHVRDILSDARRERSWEGSLAVAMMTSCVVFLSFAPLSVLEMGAPGLFVLGLFVSIAVTTGLFISVVEAWTPHGLDNLTIPIGTAFLLNGLLS